MKCRIDTKEESIQHIESFVEKINVLILALKKLNVDLDYHLLNSVSETYHI